MSKENSSQDVVLKVGFDKSNVYIYVNGEATMIVAGTLKKFIFDIVQQFCNQSNKNIYLNLSECSYMDSTFIGTLIIIEKQCVDVLDRHVLLTEPSEYCEEVLEQMGLLKVFTILKDSEIPKKININPLEMRDLDRLENAILMFQAHDELASINEENRQEFALVMKTLKEQIDIEEEKLKRRNR